MKILVFLVLLGLHSAAAVTHSLKYFYTGSSNVPNFPEFVALGMVDEAQIYHYDSNTKKAVPKQDWMGRVTEAKADYWELLPEILKGHQQTFKGNIDIVKQRFNQTGGAHINQRMYGCEWDDATGEVNGYDQFGYDGEDFIALDLKTQTWIAPKQQAVLTKHKWDNNKGFTGGQTNYLKEICVDWLKKYVNYGRSSLMRTDLPSVSLLQKTPSSPVRCHATGFYPNRAEMFWRKDGEEHHEDVERGEILPNHDGSFQMSVELNLSSVTPEAWRRYECVFQLSGVKDDIITELDKTVIQTNWGKTGDGRDGGSSGFPLGAVIGVVVVLLLLVVCIAGFFIWKNNQKGKEGFQPANTSDSGSGNSGSQNQNA